MFECPKCEFKNSIRNNFCENCGESLANNAAKPSKQFTNTKTPNNFQRRILLFSVICAGALILVYIGMLTKPFMPDPIKKLTDFYQPSANFTSKADTNKHYIQTNLSAYADRNNPCPEKINEYDCYGSVEIHGHADPNTKSIRFTSPVNVELDSSKFQNGTGGRTTDINQTIRMKYSYFPGIDGKEGSVSGEPFTIETTLEDGTILVYEGWMELDWNLFD